MALDATVGGESANSYITRTDADTYFTVRLGSTVWTSADPADKDIALQMATRKVDNLSYYGWKRNINQALEFPRDAFQSDDGVWDLDPDGNVINPLEVQNATCECALWLLKNDGEEALAQSAQRKATNVKMGTVTMDGLTSGAPSIVGPEAVQYLKKFFKKSGSLRPIRRRIFRTDRWN